MPVAPKSRRSHNRVQPLLDAAAKLFAMKGYKETTMRDIGAEIDMQPGSVYYHFKSKQDLLYAVYEQAVTNICSTVEAAIAGIEDPWQKLETAAAAHLETILLEDDYARVMIGVSPDKAPEIQAELITLRNRYEALITSVVAELPLTRGVDSTMLRLMFIGALNHTPTWYQPGGKSPAQIGRAYVKYLRDSVAR